MAVMFACMKKNEFKEVKCSTEIDGFMSCYNQHRVSIPIYNNNNKYLF
jgi:hypothetical protein